jgi:hypothetical protein
VWAGALRARSTAPVRPVIAWHPFRTGPANRPAPPARVDHGDWTAPPAQHP